MLPLRPSEAAETHPLGPCAAWPDGSSWSTRPWCTTLDASHYEYAAPNMPQCLLLLLLLLLLRVAPVQHPPPKRTASRRPQQTHCAPKARNKYRNPISKCILLAYAHLYCGSLGGCEDSRRAASQQPKQGKLKLGPCSLADVPHVSGSSYRTKSY